VQNEAPRFKEITSALLEEDIDYFFQNIGDERSQFPQPQSKQLYQWQPRQQNHRIIAQQSIFIFGDSHFEADAECVILESSKQDILTALQHGFGITESMLFPDFDGFARLRSESRIYTELSASEYRERAIRESLRGEYDLAVANYDEAIRLDPGNADTYYHRGLVHVSQEQHELAIADYDKAINLKGKDHAEFYHERGNANFSLERYSSAISDYDEVLRIFPSDGNCYYRRGLAKAALKQYALAIADYDEVIHMFPRHIELYRWRGFAKYELKQYEAAIADYDEAIRIYSYDRKSYYQRGLAKYELKHMRQLFLTMTRL
jgi:tetratricopeptide (TPR) repeat protein